MITGKREINATPCVADIYSNSYIWQMLTTLKEVSYVEFYQPVC